MPVERKLIGHVGVDSGQIMLTDPCYLRNWKNDDAHSVSSDLNEPYDPAPGEKLPYSYGGACAGTGSQNRGAELDDGTAVVCSSGFGDGFYPVYLEYETVDFGFGPARYVARMTVDFSGSDED